MKNLSSVTSVIQDPSRVSTAQCERDDFSLLERGRRSSWAVSTSMQTDSL